MCCRQFRRLLVNVVTTTTISELAVDHNGWKPSNAQILGAFEETVRHIADVEFEARIRSARPLNCLVSQGVAIVMRSAHCGVNIVAASMARAANGVAQANAKRASAQEAVSNTKQNRAHIAVQLVQADGPSSVRWRRMDASILSGVITNHS
jgi:hypothetical protein